jgi:FKBP-type peptidyl-prolyl cis-trans isomerase
MSCVVGSRANSRKNRHSVTGLARATEGLGLAALLTGALLMSPGTSHAVAQTSSNPVPQSSAESSGGSPAAKSAPGAKKSAGKTGKTAGAAATDEKSKASYAIGVSVGSELLRSKISPDSISSERIAAGVRDALSGKAQMSPEYQQAIIAMMRDARNKEAEPNHAAAAAFLAENGKKKDVVTTSSGLEYKVITPGSGEPPKPGDMVTVNYRGTLLNGTEFDSSAKHGGPATFASNQVIPGWQEALSLMKPGSKYQLFIPPKLAYDLDSPPSIPPGSMLIFDVELLSVKPSGAAGSAMPHPQIQPAQPSQQGQSQPKK